MFFTSDFSSACGVIGVRVARPYFTLGVVVGGGSSVRWNHERALVSFVLDSWISWRRLGGGIKVVKSLLMRLVDV